jgi:hypothetical protein
MITDIPAQEVQWLSRFFSGQNELQWPHIVAQTAPAQWLAVLTPWLDFAAMPQLNRPLVLPCVTGDEITAWYAVATSAEIASQMLEEIKGFIGPSFSEFTGQWNVLKPADEISAGLHERFGTHVICLKARTAADRDALQRSIILYHRILARRPATVDRTARPFGQIRADFDRALLAGNQPGAQQFLDELIATGRVNAEQRKCLEIRLLAGLGRHSELATHRSLLGSVMDLGLPPQTLVDVIEALYDVHMAAIEHEADAAVVLAQFKRMIAQPFARLFRERKGIRRPRVLRSFFLYEAAQAEPNQARCEAIVAAYAQGDEGHDLIVRWQRSLQPRSSTQSIERVRQAILDEDYAMAAEVCFTELPESWAYRALLRTAVEIPSDELWHRVRRAFDDANQQVLRELSDKDRARLERIRQHRASATATNNVNTDWIAWARAVVGGMDGATAMSVLEAAALNWNPEEFAQDAARCEGLAQLIGNATGNAEQIFRDAFPSLVEFFVDRPTPVYRSFAPVHSVLIAVIAMGGSASNDELEIATSLTRALLELGPSTAMYDDCLTNLGEILAANSAPVHLDWALGMAELLSFYPAPDGELRMRTFIAVTNLCLSNRHRLTPVQRNVLETLAADYECPALIVGLPALDAGAMSTPEAAYSGLIGIYSLNENAAERAKRALESALPHAEIEINSDHVATERLKHLARSADLFAFAWKSSKHQAYYCAKDARKERELLLPSGAGTASLVRIVLEAVKSQIH